MSQPLIGAMVLAHQRPWLLRLITAQAVDIDPWARVHIVMDRPTPEVRHAAELVQAAYMAGGNVRLYEAPFAAMGHRENFMALRQWQLDRMREDGNPQYIAIWDDDHLLADTDYSRHLLEQREVDLVYARKVFLWDDVDHANANIPEHRSPFWFRNNPGDNYPMNRMIHAPLGVHDSPTSRVHLETLTLYDAGYVRAEDRERVFRAYARCGKLDAATLPLMQPPRLVPVTADFGLRNRMRLALL